MRLAKANPDFPRGPRGITLFEVVLALAIFVGSLAVITQILQTGSRASIRAQLTSEAVMLCERCMNEVMGGVLPLESADRVPVDGAANWVYSVAVAQSNVPNLLQVTTTVEHVSPSADAQLSYSLVRMVRDPQIYYDAAAAASGETLP